MMRKNLMKLASVVIAIILTLTSVYTGGKVYADTDRAVTASMSDEETVNRLKDKFNSTYGAIRPNFAVEKNVNPVVKKMFEKYTDIDATGVEVSVSTSDDTSIVALNGDINYIASEPSTWGNNSKNVSCKFTFTKGSASATTNLKTVTVCWDRDFFASKMEGEKNGLTEDSIKGGNTDLNNVTKDLVLPQIIGNNARKAWSKITWESSNTDVISIENTGYNSLINPKAGKVKQQPDDTEVTLTATFTANDTILNSYVEKPKDFTTLTKTYKVIVKSNGQAKPTPESLKEILDKYYTQDLFKDAITKDTVDLNMVSGDINLPRYTTIKDDNKKLVFKNGEIKVTVENEEALSVNGYRLNVDPFATNKAAKVIVTFTRDGVSATKEFPLVVKPVDDSVLDAEIAIMDDAKASYFDGINDGRYRDKNSITGNLHPFKEMSYDDSGNKVWAYDVRSTTGKGIVPDDFFDDPWVMEGQGYNKFKSSNNRIVKHDNLLVTRDANTQTITIESLLSSSKFGKYAKKHPENAKLQKLYKQPVSVTVKVKGTASVKPALEQLIEKAEELNSKIVEGDAPGQYKSGVKATLQAVIDEAKNVKDNVSATEDDYEAAIEKLQNAIKTAEDSENPNVAEVVLKANKTSNTYGVIEDISVKSDEAENAGYTKPEAFKKKVTVADGLVALHKKLYGKAFGDNPKEFLEIGSNGFITKIFGEKTMNIGYLVNGKIPTSSPGMGSVANDTVLSTGDVLQAFIYGDTVTYNDRILYFENEKLDGKTGREFSVTLKGSNIDMNPSVKNEEGVKVALEKINGESTPVLVSGSERTTDENGVAKFTVNEPGTYRVVVRESKYPHFVAPYGVANITIGKTEEISTPDNEASVNFYKEIEDTLNLKTTPIKDNMEFFKEGAYKGIELSLVKKSDNSAVTLEDVVGVGKMGKVKVKLPENLRNNKSLQLYEIADGKLTGHNFQIENEEAVFDAVKLGKFIFGEKKTYNFAINTGDKTVNIEVEHGMIVDRPEDPIKEGYMFKGWFTDSDFTNPVNFNTPVTSEITIFAKWEKIDSPVKPVIPEVKPVKPEKQPEGSVDKKTDLNKSSKNQVSEKAKIEKSKNVKGVKTNDEMSLYVLLVAMLISAVGATALQRKR